MSTASPHDRLVPAALSLQRLVAMPIRATAFWTAVATPLAYPVLLAGGLHGNELSLLGMALALNVVALLLGHGHRTD